MRAGRAFGFCAVTILLAATCLCCLIFGIAAGGLAGGAAGFVAGRGSGGLPNLRFMQRPWLPTLPQANPNMPWMQVTPQAPRLQMTPQAPRLPVTPQAPRPQVTPQVPQPQRTPQALRTPLPADATGAQVRSVDAGGAAEKAGVQVGDVITAVDNAPVDANHALTDLIRAHRPGDTVTLVLLRQGQTLRRQVTLGIRRLDTGEDVASLGITFVVLGVISPTD